MKYASYINIKERIASDVTRIKKLQYKGYEDDIAEIKDLCHRFQRTVGDEAERLILINLDSFEKKLIQQEFYAKLKTQKTFKNIVTLRKIAKNNLNIKNSIDKLLNDYITLMWKYYGKKTDATLMVGMIEINKRINNINNILNSNNTKLVLTK